MGQPAEKQYQSALRVVEAIQRRFGQQIMLNGRHFAKRHQQTYLSSGYAPLDSLITGFPVGQISEIVARPSAGATTLLHHLIANTQKAGGVCVYIDLGRSFDVPYAASIGVDPEQLYLVHETSPERAMEITQLLVAQTTIPLVILDAPAMADIPLAARKRLALSLHPSQAVVVCLSLAYLHECIDGYLMGSDAGLRLLVTPATEADTSYAYSSYYSAAIRVDKHVGPVVHSQATIPIVLPEWRWR